MIANIEQIKNGQPPVAAVSAGDAPYEALKKQILNFAYRHYPALLELDIDTLRSFDLAVGKWATEAMEDQK